MAIKQTVEVEFEPTPDDLAQAIWEMDSDQQLDLLISLIEVDRPGNIYTQMDYLRCELNESYFSDEDRRKVKQFISSLYEYICEE